MKKIILSVILVLSISFTNAQCNADFTYSVDPVNSLKLTFTPNVTYPAGAFNMEPKWYVFSNMVDSINPTTVITFSASGTYKIKFYFKICLGGGMFCWDDTTKFISVYDLSTGINENALENTFSAYPNPVNDGVITLKRNANSLSNNYAISNVNGQVMKTGALNSDTEVIDLNELTAGMYFLSNAGKTIKVVKN